MSVRIAASAAGRPVRLDVEVADGETVAVTGPNGAGKSTLLLVAAGLIGIAEGTVELDGAVVATPRRSVPPHRRRVGYLPQDSTLLRHLDALGNVAFGLRMHGAGRREARSRALALLADVGAEHLAGRRPASLSGGQARRVALARALAVEPTVLLIDEPLSSVDAESRDELRSLIARHTAGRSCLLVSHDEADVATLAHRTVRMG